jgi:hypothetical protein
MEARTTIGKEVKFAIEFSLEQVHKLRPLARPHVSQAVSNRDFSMRTAHSSRPPTHVKSRSGPASQFKRTWFALVDDAKVVTLKGTERMVVGRI